MTTREAAAALSVTPDCLHRAVLNGRVQVPERNPWGYFLWSDEDVARARAALAIDRRRKEHRRPRPSTEGSAA